MYVPILVIVAVGIVLAIATYYAFKNESKSLGLIADIDRLVGSALQSEARSLRFVANMSLGTRDVVLELKNDQGGTQLRDIGTGIAVPCNFNYKFWGAEYAVATRYIGNSVKALEKRLKTQAMTNALTIKVKKEK